MAAGSGLGTGIGGSNGLGSKILFNARERSGKFELIFPFNKTSEDLAVALNKSQGSSVSGPNYMK